MEKRINMHILTVDNTAFSLDEIPEQTEETIRFCVLDNSVPKEPDYFFIPLVFMESFNAPAIVLSIGGKTIKMPMDWSILIGEKDHGDLEVIPLTAINDRGFSAFCFNPISSFRPEFEPIDVVDIYQDVKWYFPKLKSGQLLAVPLESTDEKPMCAFFIKDVNRLSEIIDYQKVW